MIDVLIVEDDPMVAQLNRKFVQSVSEFNVIGVASNGEDALTYCKRYKIDLIILDIYMPKIDGISLLKELRKRFTMIDVIFVTASKEVQNIDAVLKLGAVDYLIKPFEYERLKQSLENYAGRYILLRQKDIVKQEELDKITRSFNPLKEDMLIKGLHKKTLERIRKFIRDNSELYFSSEILSHKMGLSKVTVRKYLEYLETIGEISLKVEYGCLGRPSHLYKSIS
ncbi:MAG: response regulator [Clostridia bacterium]